MIRGVIFDMDGLMFDTERLFYGSWPEVCALQGVENRPGFADAIRGSNGPRAMEIIREFYPDVDGERLMRDCYAVVQRKLAAGVPKKKGLDELLEFLKARGIPMAIGSSTRSPMVRRNLEMAGVAGYFTAISAGEMVQRGTPEPEVFLLAARMLGLPPGDCLVLEDSHNGIRAGHAAGCVTVMVPDLAPATDEILALCETCLPDLLAVRDWLAPRLPACE